MFTAGGCSNGGRKGRQKTCETGLKMCAPLSPIRRTFVLVLKPHFCLVIKSIFQVLESASIDVTGFVQAQ